MGTYTQAQLEAMSPVTDDDEMESSSLLETLSKDSNYEIISTYMEDRFGMTEDQYDKEEIIDSYVNNMRKFNFGQSVVTLQELSYLNKGEGQSLERRRAKAANAYNLFDSLDGAFSEDRTFMEKADAVGDYARALIVDPVNVLSLGVGKIFANGATKAATALAKQAAIEAAETQMKAMGARAATQAGQNEAAKAARKAYTKKLLADSSYKSAMDKSLKREVVGTALVDSAAGVGTDLAGQRARIKAKVQEEVDPLSLFLSAAGGVAGGGLSFALNKGRYKSKIPFYSTLIDRSERVTLAARKAEMEQAAQLPIEAQDLSRSNIFIDGTERLRNFSKEWQDKVAEGLNLKLANQEIDQDTYDSAFDFNMLSYFYFGDRNTVKGLRDILYDAGVPTWTPRGEGDRFSLYVSDVYEKLDKDSQDRIQEIFDGIFGSYDNEFKGKTMSEFFAIQAKNASDAARTLSFQRHLNNLNDLGGVDFKDLTSAKAADIVLDPITKSTRQKIMDKSADFQKNFIKFIVMHPGTTALNLKGWVQASSLQSFSDMIRAGLYGLGSHIVNDDITALAYKNKSKQLVNLQVQKFRNIMDPYMTYEAAMDYLTFRPEARKELFRYINGGVEVDNVLKELEMNPGEKLSRSKFDKAVDFTQTIYGVKAQDFISKTQEFLYSLDKEVRMEYNLTLREFLAKDDVWEYLSDPKSDSYQKFLNIETKAVGEALENTFSKSYGNSEDMVGRVAQAIEDVRKFPIVGALMPFGQFFNNTLAFSAKHLGVTMLYRGMVGKEQDLMEGFSRMAAGYGTLAVITNSEVKNLEDNLAWHEERQSDGQVVSRQYDFPYSHFKLTGRVLAHMVRDGQVPDDLKTMFKEQILIEGMIRNLGEQGQTISDIVESIVDLDGEQVYNHSQTLFGDALSMYGSGYTRFADPVNQAIAMSRGEDYVMKDMKQGSKSFNEALRYTDQIFGTLSRMMGEPMDEGEPKKIATQPDTPSVPIGRVVGFRAVEAPTTIEKMFNDVGKSQWKTELYGLPEAVNIINDYIYPYLELYADAALDKGWDEKSFEDRERIVKLILNQAKRDVKDVLKASQHDEPKKAGIIYSITESSVSKEELRKIFDAFETKEENLWELDVPQLNLILGFIEDESFRRSLIEDDAF